MTDNPGRGRRPAEQPTAPYLDAVVAYGFRGSTRFHIPGHKGGPGADPALRSALGDDVLALDVPQDIEGIDVGDSPTPYERAELLAAKAYGAAQTWFLTNGATQGNHALTLALASLGAPVVVQRNSHASVVDGLVLSGGIPTWVAPEYEEELGMANGVAPERLAECIDEAGSPRAAFIVSPTYYGFGADVEACAEACHARDVPLVVDQSWGAHFGFHPAVPESALKLGADAVLTSTHKTVGSLTQTAMLHVAPTGRIDPANVARTIRLMRSTSPNSLLLASLDASRRQLAVHGEALLSAVIDAAAVARSAIEKVPGVAVVGEDMLGGPGIASWDPLRIVIDVRETGCTGYEVAAEMRASYDVQIELAAHAVIVIVLGVGQPVEPLRRFANDFSETIRRLSRPGEKEALTRPPAALRNKTAMAPRDAFLGPQEIVAVADSVGRVSAETIAGYPPGIPALLPGELITAEVVDYLGTLVRTGARLHGAADPSFTTIRVHAGD